MKSYTCHYVMQRLTACVLLVLVPWFLWNLLCVKELGYYAVLKNFANPYSATLLFFILVGGFLHGYLGIQTICTDYIPNSKIRSGAIFTVGALFSFLSMFATFCLVRLIALGH